MLSPEERVQAKIVDMLRRYFEVEVHFAGNTRIGSIAARRIRKILGSRKSWMDLLVLAPGGVTVHFEVKAPKDPLLGTKRKTPVERGQKELIAKLREWGHRVHVVYSPREVADVLAGYGVRPRVALGLP